MRVGFPGRAARRVAGFAVIAVLVAGCASSPQTHVVDTALPTPAETSTPSDTPAPTRTASPSPSPSPTPSPTPEPSPTPTPTPTADELVAACNKATPIPIADSYASTLHPLVVIYRDPDSGWNLDDGTYYAIDEKWDSHEWSNVQLVLCVEMGDQKTGSCGTYKRNSDGKIGRVDQWRYLEKVRVVVAQTGKTLQSKTFYGSTPKCTSKITIPASGPPPWRTYGSEVSDATINSYAVTVSTQAVK